MSRKIITDGEGKANEYTPQSALLLELEYRPTIHRECITFIDAKRDELALKNPAKWERLKPVHKTGWL